jgi:antitoxin (DNA-binding transcriptional repressor) of toxin-antitoxin stability system
MRVLSVREFKASFNRFVRDGEEILILSRGKPVGWFKPLRGKDLRETKKKLGLALVGLGEGPRGRISERHDEVLYG